MRSALFGLPILLVANLSDPARPACGEAALEAAPDEWDTVTMLTGDLNLDGKEDVVFWKRDGSAVLLYIAACEQGRVIETWRFRILVAEGCTPEQARVQMADLLLDRELVDRACKAGERSECQFIRRENERRQALTNAGGRTLHIGGSACAGARLHWLRELRGFMRLGS